MASAAAPTELGRAAGDEDGEKFLKAGKVELARTAPASSAPGRVVQAWSRPIGPGTSAPGFLLDYVAYTSREEELLSEVRRAAEVMYNGEEALHERTLRQLFAAVRSPLEARELPAGKDERWKELGFQSADPRTDFRGGGLFALQNLVYLAEAYPERTAKMLREANPATSSGSGVAEYLFAASCINVSAMLVLMLGLNSSPSMSPVRNMPCPANGIIRKNFAKVVRERAKARRLEEGSFPPAVEVFGELFCSAVFKLHEEWRSICVRKPNATLLDFGDALGGLSVSLERFLGGLEVRGKDQVADVAAVSLLLEPLQLVDTLSWKTAAANHLKRIQAYVLELTCSACAVMSQVVEECGIFSLWPKSSVDSDL